jgi:hypothetical protein
VDTDIRRMVHGNEESRGGSDFSPFSGNPGSTITLRYQSAGVEAEQRVGRCRWMGSRMARTGEHRGCPEKRKAKTPHQRERMSTPPSHCPILMCAFDRVWLLVCRHQHLGRLVPSLRTVTLRRNRLPPAQSKDGAIIRLRVKRAVRCTMSLGSALGDMLRPFGTSLDATPVKISAPSPSLAPTGGRGHLTAPAA